MSRLHLCRSGHFVAACCRGPYELPFNVRHATTTVEYRAAAYLRAQSFYSESYPPDRSEFARRAHLRMKADEMWRELEEKCNQDEEIRSLGSIDVLPLITAATETSMPGIAASFEDPSVALPTEVSGIWTMTESTDILLECESYQITIILFWYICRASLNT
jgi:hypothetical protein